MIAVDTNVVVRLLSRDDEAQYRLAYSLFNANQVFISTTVVLECERVLRYAYKLTPADIVAVMRRLFGLEKVALEEADRIALALDWHEQGLDFADALHLASAPKGCSFYTFDRKLISAAKHLTQKTVHKP